MTPDSNELPVELRPLFWDVDFDALNWGIHRQFIIQRILITGNWQAIRWLRTILGDDALRNYFILRQGKGLNPRQLRYWQVVLDLPADLVDGWIEQIKLGIWERRTSV